MSRVLQPVFHGANRFIASRSVHNRSLSTPFIFRSLQGDITDVKLYDVQKQLQEDIKETPIPLHGTKLRPGAFCEIPGKTAARTKSFNECESIYPNPHPYINKLHEYKFVKKEAGEVHHPASANKNHECDLEKPAKEDDILNKVIQLNIAPYSLSTVVPPEYP
ncbi:hypothetical protein B0O99DRAFT_597533 [Bisporella sp. PMI_857]|nr:hypothetical protein B0O99DRAFT_597533 [Bisporella sp. PMI_857]